jgi:hypothetical protein
MIDVELQSLDSKSCKNCRHNSYSGNEDKAFCNVLEKYIISKSDDVFGIATLQQDPSKFSCSLYKGKEK